jgi:hypothetical protein
MLIELKIAAEYTGSSGIFCGNSFLMEQLFEAGKDQPDFVLREKKFSLYEGTG